MESRAGRIIIRTVTVIFAILLIAAAFIFRAYNYGFNYKKGKDIPNSVIIEDDGVGFDVDTLEEAGKNGHVGLRYIKTRLKQLANADFEIISKVKEGTKATITIKK
jgi:signal transduction histidine kinase